MLVGNVKEKQCCRTVKLLKKSYAGKNLNVHEELTEQVPLFSWYQTPVCSSKPHLAFII